MPADHPLHPFRSCESVPGSCIYYMTSGPMRHTGSKTPAPCELTAIHCDTHDVAPFSVALPDDTGPVAPPARTGLCVRVTGKTWLRIGIVWLVFFLAGPQLMQAEEIRLESIGLRGGVSGSSPIGKKETQYFKEYDLMANWSLPWGWYSDSGWGIGTRLMGSVGALTASEDTAFIATMVPGLVLGKKDGWLSLEVGGGFALLSQHHFANQDMGGAFQFVGDIALRAKVYREIGLGYWFHHLSDATLYGDHGRGFDLHMLELSYRF
jgi:hypothetical protein